MKILSANDELLRLENALRAEGFRFIAGVDEAGRGPLAGPVVAAAVVFPPGVPLPAVNDSKKLSAASREELDAAVRAVPGVEVSVAAVTAEEIDGSDILRCTHRAMREAVRGLAHCDFVLVDGLPVGGFPVPDRSVVKGDAQCACIAAASIAAKVFRDRLMMEFDHVYPGYGFAEHKGYGTAGHLEALRRLGPCPIHRRSFAPVRELIAPPPEQPELF